MTALAERTVKVTPESLDMRRVLEVHAIKNHTTVADLADTFARQFFDLGFNTQVIAKSRGLPEAAVYNAIHAWREAGVPQSAA